MSDSKSLPPSAANIPAANIPESASETIQFVQQTDSPSAISSLFPTGTTLGHYVIKNHIGGGGMGQVYLATDAALDRDVAIKVLTQQRAADQSTVARFMNEARSAARLNHEHIAQVYFAGTESGIPYIAFEYVEGINVRTMVEEHDVFPLPQALNYLLQISHALAHAATHNVVHRDVKPSNILITREGRAKLIDMGLARLLDTSEARNDLTASGVTLGTFDYISPEQARDPRSADIRSDIYSLGCTFFFMLAGRPPFPEGTVLQKLLQHQGDAPPDIRSFQPTIPAEIAFLIQKMMAKDPRQRFQTPTVLIEALTDAARHLGLRPAGQGNLVWTPVQANRTSFMLRHLPWITAVSLLFIGYFFQSFFSDFYDPFPLPDVSPAVPTIVPPVVVAPVPVEPVKTPSSSFDVAFIASSAAPHSRYAAGLSAKTVGGSLQPRLMAAAQFPASISGQFSMTDVELKKQETTTPQAKPLSAVRCVDPTANTIGSYPSLASALLDAEDGTVIELKWDNIYRITEPIQLDNRKLRIVAVEGYHPILLFDPTTELQSVRSFFVVLSSNLEFHHVGLEIRLNPNIMSPHWSLFELSDSTRLTFEQCCLTIQNRTIFDDAAYHDDVVFFRNSIPIDNLERANDSTNTMLEPLTIEVKDSLLRGEAAAIQSNIPQDIHVSFSNSLLALARSFIQIEESRRLTRQATIQIHWNKMVLFGRQSIASLYGVTGLSKETAAEPMVVNFESHQSIFVLNNFPFATFSGFQSLQKVLNNFRWSGSANYFQGITKLHFRTPASSPEMGTVSEISLEEWQQQDAADTNSLTKMDSLEMSEIVKPVSQFLPQDMRSAFDSTDNIPLPDLDWFPKQWSD